MAEKENKQKHKSTIDKYFSRTTKAYKAWAEEDEEERNYLQIAAETTGDADEDGNQGYNFHIAYSGGTNLLSSGIAQAMQGDEFIRSLILAAARKFSMYK